MSQLDHLDIPPISYNYIQVELDAETLKVYKNLERKLFAVIDGNGVTAQTTAQATMKCHQLANGRVYEDIPEELSIDERKSFLKNRKILHSHSHKLEAISELASELNGKPLLVAYQYKHDLEALRSCFGPSTPYIGSGVDEKTTLSIIEKWNRGEIPILLGYPGSMAHGLNMQQSANDICWFSLTWNLEHYIQFNKRLHRSGVKGGVRIHHIVSENTIDEAMISRLDEKATHQEDLRVALREYRNR
jgi:SNF2 family DNA or RNA helicase